MMDKEEKLGKEDIPNSDNDEVIINDGIEFIPYQSPIVSEVAAVGYGPDPMLIEAISSIGDDDIIFTNFDDTIIVDVDSDMYGGPWPEDVLLEETDLSDLNIETDFLYEDDDINSEGESKDMKSNKYDDINDYFV